MISGIIKVKVSITRWSLIIQDITKTKSNNFVVLYIVLKKKQQQMHC